jgi:hypothetical protein
VKQSYPGLQEPSAAPAAANFRATLEALRETQYGLAKRLAELGDQRPFNTILRSIQRTAAGETKVSGEMQAILGMLVRERERARVDAVRLEWSVSKSGVVTTATKGFEIVLIPERAGWRVEVRDQQSGYRHPWPKFPANLDDAKVKSLLWLEDAFHYLRTMDELDRLNAAQPEMA